MGEKEELHWPTCAVVSVGLFCCRSMLSKAFAWTALLSTAAGAPEPSAVGPRQTGRASV